METQQEGVWGTHLLLRGVRRAAEDTSSCRKAGGHPSEFSSPDPESGTSQRLASVLSVAWTGAQLGSALVSACGGPMPMAELRAHCTSLLPPKEECPGAGALLLVSGHTVNSVVFAITVS